MIFLAVFVGLVLISYGLFMIFYPKKALDLQYMFTLSGKRKYTDWAIKWTVVGGVFIVGAGIFSIFVIMTI